MKWHPYNLSPWFGESWFGDHYFGTASLAVSRSSGNNSDTYLVPPVCLALVPYVH